jgi:MotA/TolQ/ExbB proton channel family
MTDVLASTAEDFPASSDRPATPPRTLAKWFAALSESDAAGWRYHLMLRFAVINLVASALFCAAWIKGWIGLILAGDSTHQVVLIAAIFAYGLVRCGGKIFTTSVELNRLGALGAEGRSQRQDVVGAVHGHDAQTRAIRASALRLKLMSRIGSIRHIANSLVFFGLLGTVIGFIMALSGVNADTAGDVESIKPMVATLLDGMSVALYTTLVGAVLNVWLMVNYRLLESGTVTLFTAIVELGERHVRA